MLSRYRSPDDVNVYVETKNLHSLSFQSGVSVSYPLEDRKGGLWAIVRVKSERPVSCVVGKRREKDNHCCRTKEGPLTGERVKLCQTTLAVSSVDGRVSVLYPRSGVVSGDVDERDLSPSTRLSVVVPCTDSGDKVLVVTVSGR